MTPQQKLQYIITKAIEGGWSADDGYTPDNLAEYMLSDSLNNAGYPLETIIFNHDFAKSIWGEEYMSGGDYYDPTLPAFEYHLQQAVINPRPINYIYESIKE